MRSGVAFAVCVLALVWTAGATGQDRLPRDEETVTGTVDLVRQDGFEGCDLCGRCADCAATHVLLRAGSRRIEVHLAPAWFLDGLELIPSAGDQLTVTGARVRLAKSRGIAAREVRVGNTTFRLRDAEGRPLWRRALTDTREPGCDRSGASR